MRNRLVRIYGKVRSLFNRAEGVVEFYFHSDGTATMRNANLRQARQAAFQVPSCFKNVSLRNLSSF